MWNFSPLAPALKPSSSRFGLAVRPARLVDAVEVDEGVGEEPAGVGLVERGEGLLEPVVPAAVEVDDRPHAGGVHLGQIGLHALGRQNPLAAAEVVVDVDDGNLGFVISVVRVFSTAFGCQSRSRSSLISSWAPAVPGAPIPMTTIDNVASNRRRIDSPPRGVDKTETSRPQVQADRLRCYRAGRRYAIAHAIVPITGIRVGPTQAVPERVGLRQRVGLQADRHADLVCNGFGLAQPPRILGQARELVFAWLEGTDPEGPILGTGGHGVQLGALVRVTVLINGINPPNRRSRHGRIVGSDDPSENVRTLFHHDLVLDRLCSARDHGTLRRRELLALYEEPPATGFHVFEPVVPALIGVGRMLVPRAPWGRS